LREKPGLDHPRDIQFLRCAAFGVKFFGDFAALRFERTAHIVESNESERVPVDVVEPREHSTPNRRLGPRLALARDPPQPRRETKMDSALAPFRELGDHVLREENDRGRPADERIVFRIRIGCYQPQHRSTVGRRHRHQTVARLQPGIQCQIESELLCIEFEAPILIAHVNVDGVDPQVRILAVQAKGCWINRTSASGFTTLMGWPEQYAVI